MLVKKTLAILEEPVCDHCLGRQFGQLLSGYTNNQRGKILRTLAAMAIDHEKDKTPVDQSNFTSYTFHAREQISEKQKPCAICDDFFAQTDAWVQKIAKKVKPIEFDTFLIGTKLPVTLIDKEERLWERVGIDYCEPLNAEINREIGKRLAQLLEKTFDAKRPDIAILVNVAENKIRVTIHSLLIYGEYQKRKRGIPQTKWPSGKYKTSVEQIIAKPYMQATKGTGHKLHGMGREDIDARCLGWRPFVLEILEPKKRTIPLKALAKKITGAVKIMHVRRATKQEVQRIKEARPEKTYQITVMTNDPITAKDLKKLQHITEVQQYTPTRVRHRRAQKTRTRKVKHITATRKTKTSFRLIIRGEAGLYIKELVTGDQGKTVPSVAQILGTPCTYKDLDVVKIHF